MARIEANPAIGSGCTTASVPPATTMSARPERMMSSPSAIASEPVAQALATQCTPAWALSSRPTQAAGPLGMSIGTVCGDTRRGPLASRMSSWFSSVCAPPMPEPMLTARRSLSISGAPASAHASRAAMIAVISERSSRRAWTRSITSVGSTASCAAMRTGSWAAHSWVSGPTPERPVTIPSHVEATSPPSGVVAPSPVMTTSAVTVSLPCPGPRDTRARSRSCLALGLDDVGDRVADRLEVLHLVVGDLHAELLLGRNHDLDHRQRVHVEVLGEGLLLGHVIGVDPGHLFEDFGQAAGDVLTARHVWVPFWKR